MHKQLTNEELIEIKTLSSLGWTQKMIAEKIGRNQSSISRILKKIKLTQRYNRKKGSGRKFKLNQGHISLIESEVEKDPKIGSTKLAIKLKEDSSIKVSSRTIRNYLKNIGYKAFISCKKPLLSKKNKGLRFDFASKYLWEKETFWERIIWSDETKINVFGSDGRRYVRRKIGTRLEDRNLTPTVKFGKGGLMIWGCFTSKGVGKIEIIKGTMDAVYYTKILNNNLQRSAENLKLGSSFIFQHDNDPKHKARITNEWLLKNDICVLDWPPQSPDMNPIENVWVYLKKKVNLRRPTSLKNLEEIVIDEWYKIPNEVCLKLVKTMEKRIEELFRSKGGHTKY